MNILTSKAFRVGLLTLIYFVLAVCGAAHHEPWADEAQAWLLARDNSWLEMMTQYLRYEGSPGLWHSLLYIPAHLGLPYEDTISKLSIIFSTLGVALFLWLSPFPFWVSALVPFTYFCLYQYGIVARSYCLLLPLMTLSAHYLRTWPTRPLRFFGALALVAHVSLHGALLACAFGTQALWEGIQRRHEFTFWRNRRILAGGAMLVGSLLAMVLIVTPPADLNFPLGELSPLGSGARYIATSFSGHDNYPVLLQVLLFVLVVATFVWSLWKRSIFGIVSGVLLTTLAAFKYWNIWHEGILLYAWIFALWVAWDYSDKAAPKGRLKLCMAGAMALILSLQVYYTVATYKMDWRGIYSASRDTATYLHAQELDKSVWSYDFWSVALQPYFTGNIYSNQSPVMNGKAFWLWSSRNEQQLPIKSEELCAGQPLAVVLPVLNTQTPDDVSSKALKKCGYTLDKTFTGYTFFKGQVFGGVSYLIYRK